MSTPNCESCDTPMEQWPTGLYSEDREHGQFTGTCHVCPSCVDAWHFTGHLAPDGGSSTLSMLRDGIAMTIRWFWWDADRNTSSRFIGRGQLGAPTHISEFTLNEP